jgi:L-fuconolactonase
MDIVDPHHHLWNNLRAGVPDYLVADLQRDINTVPGVTKTVFVECGWSYRTEGPEHLRVVGETEAVAAVAPGSPISAIVGTADLRLPAHLINECLDAHVTAGKGLFRGIRDRLAHDEQMELAGRRFSDAEKITDPAFVNGLRVLADRGFTFDAWLYHPQLDNLGVLAAQVPDLTIVVDHLGAPLGIGTYAYDRDAVLATWRASMLELAKRPNVVVKVGGIGMVFCGMALPRVDGASATADEVIKRWGPSLRFIIDTFGPGRAMFESNFPVDGEGIDYAVLWEVFDRVSEPYSLAERALLHAGTAERVYSLSAGG